MRDCASSVAAFLVLLSLPLAAEDPVPGSVLVYPSIRETAGRASVISFTNIHPSTTIRVHVTFVNVVPSANPLGPSDCLELDRTETLTPNDTFTAPVSCYLTTIPKRNGYIVVNAVTLTGSPNTPVSHDYLIGSEFVAFGTNSAYSLSAISIPSFQPDGAFIDFDGDGELDFDGIEYQALPDKLHIDQFLASAGNNLALINLTGGTKFTAVVAFSVFNDNEFALSHSTGFRCWFDQPLDNISPVFSAAFLSANTPNDPNEIDADCDGIGDVESGWATIDGAFASSSTQFIQNPALLGAVTGSLGFERGRPLWRTGSNTNGDFLNHALNHPEFP